MYKTHQVRTSFRSYDVEKWHAAEATSTFSSQNVKKLTGSDHFSELRCRKMACRWSEKHILKSKCTKHTRFGPVFGVTMSKNGTLLKRQAHFQVKMLKNWRVRTTFQSYDVEKWHAAEARSTFWSQNVQNTPGSGHFLKLRCRTIARRCSEKHICKSKCTNIQRFGPFLEVRMSKRRPTDDIDR